MSPPKLTERQEQVLLLAGDNLTRRQIADTLGVKVRTVDCHLELIRGKLGARSTRELVPLARRYFGGPGPIRL